MKVKDVLRDLGPTTLVQIYRPSPGGYVERFQKAYPAQEINYLDYSWVKSDLDKEVDHTEYQHCYTTDEMVASCNIYLKADVVKAGDDRIRFGDVVGFKTYAGDVTIGIVIDIRDGNAVILYKNIYDDRLNLTYKLLEDLRRLKITYSNITEDVMDWLAN